MSLHSEDASFPLRYKSAFLDSVTRYCQVIERELKLCYASSADVLNKDWWLLGTDDVPISSPGAQMSKYFTRDFWVTQLCGDYSRPTAWKCMYEAFKAIDAVGDLSRGGAPLVGNFIRYVQLKTIDYVVAIGEGLQDMLPLDLVQFYRRAYCRETYADVEVIFSNP